MRVGIDARFYGPIGKGLGRYTQKLIENLEEIDTENKYYIFLRKENFNEYQPQNKNFRKVLADYQWYGFSEQINMPRLLKKYNLDLVHFPHFNVPLFYRKKFIVTIHDLILLHFPTVRGTTLNPLFYWLKFMAYKIVIGSAIKRANGVIAVSNFTKKDILKHYKIPEEKIAVTYEACSRLSANYPPKKGDRILEKYGIMKPYILYIGNAYPHKNLEKLVLAFVRIAEKNPQLHLTLVGKEDYFYKILKNFVWNNKLKNIIFSGHISDEDLNEIYRNSEMYIFPSLYEGFGLPPLEAMASGIPVAASNHECIREVLGNAAYYFDGLEIEELESAMAKITTDENLRKDLIAKGYGQVKKYDWKKTAEQTLEIYQKD